VIATQAPRCLKACCADLWAHPGIRLLVGEATRPGGTPLTRSALDRMELPVGARVLDVGCGTGATLGLLRERGVRAVGLDYSTALAAEAGEIADAVVGDAEGFPFRSETFDAACIECVLSALPGKRAAVTELARVVVPGGAVLLSDMTLVGRLPPLLDSFAGWIACAAGALPPGGYVELLEGAGLKVERVDDHREALVALIGQARRRLALLQGALGTNVVARGERGFDAGVIELGQALLGQAMEAVRAGTLGYAVLIARRPGSGRPVTAAGAHRAGPEPTPVARPAS